jgi:hypothetical protein
MFFDRSGKFIYLLGSLLVLLIAGAIVQKSELGNIIFNVLLSVTLLASIYAISQNRRFVMIGIGVASLTFASAWLAELSTSTVWALISTFLAFIYFLYAAVVIVVHIFKAATITVDELLASVSTYLLLGIGGGFIFRFLELLDPGALVSTSRVAPEISAVSPVTDYIYYSFSCLTTLGFGDIVPATPEARVFSYLAAVVGQIFLTVLIARFVGLHISQSGRR